MKAQEKKLVSLLLVLLTALLIVRGVPWLKEVYQSGQRAIALQEQRIERYQNLIADTELWQEREQLKRLETEEYQSWVFASDDQTAVSVQRALRLVAEQAGIAVQRMQLPELSIVGDWLKVSQNLTFTIEQQEILPFLQALNEQKPRLFITDFQIRHNRRQYTGDITVVGFSRAPQDKGGEQP